ncbi:MAG: tetratricopeptide repeat protein [Alphaproteobacteria bacterium]|nr:tetratricopeptide repeat protein [Alphaproteobacteria bacterium]
MSVAWFLNRARRLLHDGRAAEAYQITLAALDLYPGSADVRLGAAFAAMRSGRSWFGRCAAWCGVRGDAVRPLPVCHPAP